MAWFGKVLGGVIGFALVGPIGAIAGAALGHTFIDDKNKKKKIRFKTAEERDQYTFFVTSFACLGKLANADGKICEKEIQTLEKYMTEKLELDSQSAKFAKQIFFEAAKTNETYESYASQFYQCFRKKRSIILLFMQIQIQMAYADETLSKNEERLLQYAKQIFQISENEFNRMKSEYSKTQRSYYKILGVTKEDSIETIKKSYRKLIKEYHPDVLTSKGLPPEMLKVARNKFENIQEAYAKIKEEKKF